MLMDESKEIQELASWNWLQELATGIVQKASEKSIDDIRIFKILPINFVVLVTVTIF